MQTPIGILEKTVILERLQIEFPDEDHYMLGLATLKALRTMEGRDGITMEIVVAEVKIELERLHKRP